MARNPATPARTTRNTRNSKVAVPTILSARLSALLREARWLVFAVLAAWLALVLASYNPLDPGWSHATHVEHVHNHGGRLGAWMSDMLLYLFGMSAWWWVVLLLQRVMAGYQRLADLIRHPEGPEVLPRVHWEQAVGFVALLLGSVGLEALRFTSWGGELPAGSGGVIGMALADFTSDALGYTGGTMVLVLLVLVGLSLFFRFSWLAVAEWVGWQLEKGWLAIKAVLDELKERRQRQREFEANLMAQAQAQREAEPALSEFDSPQPLRAEPAASKPVVPSRAESPRAERSVPAPAAQRLEPALHSANTADAAFDDDFDDDEAFENLPASQAFTAAAVGGATAAAATAMVATAATAATAAAAAPSVSPPAPRPAAPPPATTLKPRPPMTVPLQGSDTLPSLDLLDQPPANTEVSSPETLEFQSRLIEKKLGDFGVEVTVEMAQPGPVITRFEIAPATGVKGSQVVNLSKDLARALSLVSIRVVETIPGKNLMGLELPNPRRQTVRLTEVLGSPTYHDSKSLLTLALGVDIAGHPVVADLARMPHLLVAGTTGSGKSVGINAMILSLLYKADASQVRLILIDPKMLEMSVYEGIPHLLAPVVTDMRQAANALNWCVAEMERRYKLMSKMGVRNLAGYNAKIAEAAAREELIPNPFSLTPDAPEPLTHLPFVVVVIDELADLMMVVGKKIEELIARLAQKARAAGIHLILATQRPSVDVITGLIKANIPTRIAFQVSSKIDSRTILDQMGAEALLGQGDMLYLPPGTGLPQRVHGAFVSDDEVHRVVEQLKVNGEANYIDGILEGTEGETGDGVGSVTGFADAESDPLYDQAVAVVLEHRRASISLVQRHLRIGYNRSARLLEQMERAGLVSSMQGNGNREILVPANNSKDD